MRKKAAALAYDEYKDHAPRVIASGQGKIAEAKFPISGLFQDIVLNIKVFVFVLFFNIKI